jgi:hypothetical protein
MRSDPDHAPKHIIKNCDNRAILRASTHIVQMRGGDRSRNHTAPGTMNALVTLARTIDSVEEVLARFVALRDGLSEEDWDTLQEAPLLEALLDSLADLEDVATG